MSNNLAVLVSGTGSLLEAMINQGLQISFVLADRKCRGIEIARKAGLPCLLLPRIQFGRKEKFDRTAYTREAVQVLKGEHIEFNAMAGWMTLFEQPMFDTDGYPNRLLNTHPAILPAFKGDKAVQDALDYGVKITGCTIHLATIERDVGPILAQAAVLIQASETKDHLHERIKQIERVLYPMVIHDWRRGKTVFGPYDLTGTPALS